MNRPPHTQTRPLTTHLAALTALAALVVLTACNTTPTPTTHATTTHTTQTTTSDYLPIPEAAQQNTPDGAKAFVQFFFDNYNHTAQYPTTGAVSRLCLPTSKSCEALEDSVTILLKDKTHFSGAIIKVLFVTDQQDTTGSNLVFGVRLRGEAVDLVDSQGNSKRRFQGRGHSTGHSLCHEMATVGR